MSTVHLFIIGPMGSGKTTLGETLATLSGLPCVDLDKFIEQTLQQTIFDLFSEKGEAIFRQHEHTLLKKLCERKQATIISTGGGIVLNKKNRTLLKKGCVIYLKTSIETQLSRLKNETKTRPLLRNQLTLPHLKELNAQRNPFYEKLADFCISTEQDSAETLANSVLQSYSEFVKAKRKL